MSAAPNQRNSRRPRRVERRSGKLSYMLRWLPRYSWQRLTRHLPSGKVHLIFALADHFEPGTVPGDGRARVSYQEQQRRLELWFERYPRLVENEPDHDGRCFVHTYFYPAEQYDRSLIAGLAEHCHDGYGEIEIHLHHGVDRPDTAENTRRALVEFRDALAFEHGCLCRLKDSSAPRYAFVHGNFALANSNGGRGCGVDNEIAVLAESGCYADMTLPTGAFHRAQIGKINSLYECGYPLYQRAPHRIGRDLVRGRAPTIYPLMIQGPLMLDFSSRPGRRRWGLETGAWTARNPPSTSRLELWKKAAIRVCGRPDWLFIKLHCHSMDPTQADAVLGAPVKQFLRQLVEGAEERGEILHFVSAREMVNIILAACDGREGNPGEYRDYRLQPLRRLAGAAPEGKVSGTVLKGK